MSLFSLKPVATGRWPGQSAARQAASSCLDRHGPASPNAARPNRAPPFPRLKTISLVIRSTQGAEEVLRTHEEQLKEAQAVPATLPELEATKASLKVLGPGSV